MRAFPGVALLLLSSACGGVARHSAHDGSGGDVNDSTSGGALATSSSGGEPASGGALATSSSGGEPGTGGVSGGAPPSSAGASSGPTQISASSFDEPNWTHSGAGLWIVSAAPGVKVEASPDGSDALHLAGTASATGSDIYWHMAAPLDGRHPRVSFRAQSSLSGGSLIVAWSGRDSSYYADLAAGHPWRAREFELSQSFVSYELDLETLQSHPGETPTYNGLWTAVHFIAPANRDYDIWIDDVDIAIVSN